jgi:hypothetical protein
MSLHNIKLQNCIHMVQRLSQRNLRFCTVAIFKRFVKQNFDSNKTCTHAHDLSCPKLHLSNIGKTVHELSP